MAKLDDPVKVDILVVILMLYMGYMFGLCAYIIHNDVYIYIYGMNWLHRDLMRISDPGQLEVGSGREPLPSWPRSSMESPKNRHLQLESIIFQCPLSDEHTLIHPYTIP